MCLSVYRCLYYLYSPDRHTEPSSRAYSCQTCQIVKLIAVNYVPLAPFHHHQQFLLYMLVSRSYVIIFIRCYCFFIRSEICVL